MSDIEWDDLEESAKLGLINFFNRLTCIEEGHPQELLEAFLENDDIQFRCKRCGDISYGG